MKQNVRRLHGKDRHRYICHGPEDAVPELQGLRVSFSSRDRVGRVFQILR